MSNTTRRLQAHDQALENGRSIVGPGREYSTYNGTSGDNTFSGGSGDDIAYGNGGNDTLKGFAGNDRLYGGDGNDTLDGGLGNDTIQGDAGTNSIKGADGDDTINSYDGADTIDGGAGYDRWYANYSNTAVVALVFDYATGGGTLNGKTLAGLEYLDVTAGAGSDTFTVKNYSQYGSGYIYAGDGIDTVTVDNSGLTTGTSYYLNNDGSSYSSYYYYYGAPYFDGVEKVAITAGSGDDGFQIYALAPSAGTSLSLDGGAGTDYLSIGLSAVTNATFTVAGTTVTGNAGAFKNFETFNVTLGGGTNTVTTGAGDDTINSYDGADTIDGGAGYDRWTANYSDTATVALAFDYATGGGTLNGKTLAGLEYLDVTAGAGSDTFTVKNYSQYGSGYIYAGDGIDTVTVDNSGLTTGTSYYLNNDGSSYSSYYYYYGAPYFDGVEKVAITAGSGDDGFQIYALAPSAGTSLSLDGGAGTDYLSIDLSALTNATFTVAGTAVTSNAGTFKNFETFNVTLGGGTNTVTTGAGDDTITSNDGADTIDGGAGYDRWTANYSDTATVALAFDYATGGGTLNGKTLAGLEYLDVTAGAGSDTFTVKNYSQYGSGYISAGDGIDTVTVDNSGLTTAGNYYLDNDGSSYRSYYYYYGAPDFDGVEKVAITAGSGDDTFDIYALAPSAGASLSLDGGAGTDFLSIDFSPITNATFVVSGAAVTGNTGTFKNFERFEISVGKGINTVTTGAGDDYIYGGNTTALSGADTFAGGDGSDSLYGYLGDDVLLGGAGDDYLDGGTGTDTASYADASSGVTVTIKADAQDTLGAGLDTLVAIENLTGSAFNDTLAGNTSANVIDGGLGNDTMNGGAATDTVSYASATGGVTVDLSLTTAQATGGAGTDTLASFENLSGSAFDDVLAGTSASNVLTGRGGFDTVSYAKATAAVTVSLAVATAQATGGAGSDTLVGISALIGSAFADTLTGNASANRIEGGAGDDKLDGGAGVDTASFASAGTGVSVSLAAQGAAQATGAGSDTLTGFEGLLGSAFADTLTGDTGANALGGGAGNDVLAGGAGDDGLTGGAGSDSLDGGAGTDTAVLSGRFVDYDIVLNGDGSYTATDRRSGAPDGVDTLIAIERVTLSSGTFAIADTVNVGPVATNDTSAQLVEAGSATAGVATATGQVLANDTDANLNTAGLGETLVVATVAAGAGTPVTVTGGGTVIQGTYGALTLAADGTYSYALDNSRAATEALAEGQSATDLFTYTIADAHGATSTATLTVGITGSGDQSVTATDDSLVVTTGLASSLNAAVLVVNDLGASGETFTVTAISNMTGGTATLTNGKLVITLTGASGGFDYVVTGSQGGTDTGHVTLTGVTTSSAANVVTVAADTAAADLQGQSGNDTLTGSAGSDRLVGGVGNDTLDGKAGDDLLDGGAGTDTYVIDSVGDTIVEAAGSAGGTDTVKTTLASYTLADVLENLTYTGSAAFTGTGNKFANVITGGAGVDTLYGLDGNDTLSGGAGADTLTGGAGSDTYVIDNTGDTIVEAAGTAGGTDTVKTTLTSYTLVDVLENLTFTGSAAFTGTGNKFANTITGGSGADLLYGLDGNDKLDGGAGADTLTGGVGNDSYVVDNAGDTIVEATGSSGGTDTVTTALASYTLADGLENLTGTLKTGFAGTGNAAANTLTGGVGNDALSGLDGNDKLDGGKGADQLTGGVGNDSYVVDNSGDTIIEAIGASGGTDTVTTSLASYTLADGLENLTGTLKTGFTGSGNSAANLVTGGTGNDTLSGLVGDDVLNGGTGNDVLSGGDNNDLLTGSTGTDTMTGGAGADTFIFVKTTDFGPTGALDAITEFSTADGDKISLKSIDPSTASGDQSFTFIGAAAFTGASGSAFELRYQAAATAGDLIVQGDINHDGTADFSFIVHAPTLQAADFVL